MYFVKVRVYQVQDSVAYFQIGDDEGNPILVKVALGRKSDKLSQAHKLAEMPVDFFLQFEEVSGESNSTI